MTILSSYLLTGVFGPFVARDPAILCAIDKFDGDLELSGEALVFTLPALFEFVRISFEEHFGRRVDSDRDSYLRFRKSLYSNPTNRLLMARGGRVEIETPHPDHNMRVYRLVRNMEGGCRLSDGASDGTPGWSKP